MLSLFSAVVRGGAAVAPAYLVLAIQIFPIGEWQKTNKEFRFHEVPPPETWLTSAAIDFIDSGTATDM